MTKFFKKKLKLSNIQFGEYIELVEAYVYQIEVFANRCQNRIDQLKAKLFLSIAYAVFMAVSVVLLPLTLLQLSVLRGGNKIESGLYVLWAIAGVILIKMQFKKIRQKIINLKEIRIETEYAYSMGVNHCHNIVTGFFERMDEPLNIFHNIPPKELDILKNIFSDVEFDIEQCSNIAHKAEKCNNTPFILSDEHYEKGREEAKTYLDIYFLNKRTLEGHRKNHI